MLAGVHEEEYESEGAINDDTNEEEREEYTKDAFVSCEKRNGHIQRELFTVSKSITLIYICCVKPNIW